MNGIKAVLTITPNGFNIVIVPMEREIEVSAEEVAKDMAKDGRLGLLASSSSATTLVKALNQLLQLGTGQPGEMLQLAQKN